MHQLRDVLARCHLALAQGEYVRAMELFTGELKRLGMCYDALSADERDRVVSDEFTSLSLFAHEQCQGGFDKALAVWHALLLELQAVALCSALGSTGEEDAWACFRGIAQALMQCVTASGRFGRIATIAFQLSDNHTFEQSRIACIAYRFHNHSSCVTLSGDQSMESALRPLSALFLLAACSHSSYAQQPMKDASNSQSEEVQAAVGQAILNVGLSALEHELDNLFAALNIDSSSERELVVRALLQAKAHQASAVTIVALCPSKEGSSARTRSTTFFESLSIRYTRRAIAAQTQWTAVVVSVRRANGTDAYIEQVFVKDDQADWRMCQSPQPRE